MQTLIEAVICSAGPGRDLLNIFAWDLRLVGEPRLMVGTDGVIKHLVLDEARLRTYARTFDFERARRWVLDEIRHAPAA